MGESTFAGENVMFTVKGRLRRALLIFRESGCRMEEVFSHSLAHGKTGFVDEEDKFRNSEHEGYIVRFTHGYKSASIIVQLQPPLIPLFPSPLL